MSSEHSASDSVTREATAREFVAVVFRRKWVIIGLFAATTATVLVIGLSTPITYTSLGKVQINRGEKETVMNASRLITAWEEELATEVQVVRSVPVVEHAQRILDERAAAGDRKLTLSPGNVDARVEGTSTVLRIDYTDRDPVVAQKACDAMITAYVEHRRDASIAYPRKFFEDEIGQVQSQLAKLEQDRRGYTNRLRVFDLSQQRATDIGLVASLRSSRNEVAADLAEAQSTYRLMDELGHDPSVDLPIMGRDYENVLVDLKVKILNQESKLAQLRERYREDAPEIVNTQATLETMRSMLKREVDSRLKVTRSRVQVLEARLVPIDRDIEEAEQRLSTMPNKEATLREMDQQIATLRARFEELNRNNDQAQITERTTVGVKADVLLPAGRAIPNNARDYVRLALAPAFSLVVGFGLVFFIDGLDSRVRTPRDVETALDLPVLASLTERRKSL